MNVSEVAEEMAEKLRAIAGLRVTAYHPAKPNPPCAFPDLPESIEYDTTYNRGLDAMTMPVVVMIGLVSDRASHQQIGKYMDGSGARSVKQALDSSGGNLYTSCDTVTVQSCTPMIFVSNGINYLAAEFATRVAGQGSDTP